MAANGTLLYNTINNNDGDKASIVGFYRSANVLITGATGFVGKTLLEKLLRTCPAIDKVYLLMRAKRGMTVAERLTVLLDSAIFGELRQTDVRAFDKIVPIEGDVAAERLGLTATDAKRLVDTVDVCFHSAATVRFDEPLKVALTVNTRGTRNVLELLSTFKRLKCYVHVSTAYSNADRRDVEEIVYEAAVDPNALIDAVGCLSNEAVEAMGKHLMNRHPNSYTFAKSLAERLVANFADKFPCAIVRPSIVCAAWRDPLPGWVDNLAGITGVMMQVGRGTIRSIVYDDRLVSDIIPVDVVASTLIAAAWYVATFRQNEAKVYNCTSGRLNPITWKEVGDLTQKFARLYPTKLTLFYPGFTTRTSWFVHQLYAVVLHKMPARLLDVFLRLTQRKPVMAKICDKFESVAKVGAYFRLNEWQFGTREFETLMETVKSTTDANLFDIDVRTTNGFDWHAYFEDYTLGIRRYLVDEKPETLAKARRKLQILYYAQKLFNLLAIYGLVRFVMRLVARRNSKSYVRC